jgi:hypothetical protein
LHPVHNIEREKWELAEANASFIIHSPNEVERESKFVGPL